MNLLRPVVIWGAVSALVVFGIGTLINPDGHQQLPTSAAITHTAAIPAPSRPAEPADNIHGRARAVTGDTLRIGRALVKLNHVVAPETGQTCTRADGRTWRCGEDARAALARLLRGARVDCTLSDDGSVGSIARGDCRKGDADLGSALVRDGHVFAETGFFARHASLESEARDNHRGMWAGQAQRPETFRAAAWEAARQKAPDSCPIKGRVTSRSKLYVMPWMDGYDSIKIRSSRGERWFCSEEDARRAGWRPSGIP
jgi:endonuclease YncB( thermonuclease family)